MSTFSQLFPPAPHFTEESLPDLHDRVYLITGATSGVGLELSKLLYSRNATVYVSGRSSSSASDACKNIRDAHRGSSGRLEVLPMDLSQLQSIKLAAEQFLARERRLDVLFHNAGVMTPPTGSRTQDGYDLELGTNCLAPFLLTRLLEPVLEATASRSDVDSSVRVVFVSSMINSGVPSGGVHFDHKGNPAQLKAMANYMQSKAGDVFLASEFAKDLKSRGITVVSLNPGLLKTGIQRHGPPPLKAIASVMFKGPKYGAYTELYAGLAPDVKTGKFYIPFGRRGEIPDHIERSMANGKSGESVSRRFYTWCEQQVGSYLLVADH